MKRALADLSKERVEDTLLAEAGEEIAEFIRRFDGGKAEHNVDSLAELLGPDSAQITKRLVTLGFLQPGTQSWKVPVLWRQGLSTTQGRAF